MRYLKLYRAELYSRFWNNTRVVSTYRTKETILVAGGYISVVA